MGRKLCDVYGMSLNTKTRPIWPQRPSGHWTLVSLPENWRWLCTRGPDGWSPQGVSDVIDSLGRSILTGYYLANALLFPALRRVNAMCPNSPTREWIDDLSQIVACTAGSDDARIAVRSAAILIDAFRADGLVISEKSRILLTGCP